MSFPWDVFEFLIARISMGAPAFGAELGPDKLYEALDITSENIWRSNIYHRDNFKNCSYELKNAYVEFVDQVSHRVQSALINKKLPVVLGGDHSLSLGTLTGLRRYLDSVSRNDVGVIWIDAHTDIHTPHSSTSNNLHGMPLGAAFLSNAGFLDDLRGTTSKFPMKGLCYIGVRDIDPEELLVLHEHGIWMRTSEEVRDKGAVHIASEAILHLKNMGFNAAHISFDIDAMDPSFATATTTPVNNGISYSDAKDILSTLISGITPIMLEIVELNPPRDVNNESLQKMVEITKLALSCYALKLSKSF